MGFWSKYGTLKRDPKLALTLDTIRATTIRATAQFGWTRDVLLNQIKASAYERAVKEKKTHNFPIALA